MGRSSSSTSKDALALFHSLGSVYSAAPTTLKVSAFSFSLSLALSEILNINTIYLSCFFLLFFFFFSDHRSLRVLCCLHSYHSGTTCLQLPVFVHRVREEKLRPAKIVPSILQSILLLVFLFLFPILVTSQCPILIHIGN